MRAGRPILRAKGRVKLNEKIPSRLLTLVSIAIIAFSVLVFCVGIYTYLNLGWIETDLPVENVGQFRDISNLMPLVSELSSDLDAILVRNKDIERGRLGFTMRKIESASSVIVDDFKGNPPEELGLIIEETSLLLADLSKALGANALVGYEEIVLYKNRIDYVYSQLRDFILRINNSTLAALQANKGKIGLLRNAMLASTIMVLISALLTFALLRSRYKLIKKLEASRELALASSAAKGEFLSNMSHEIRTPMNAIIGLSYLALKTDLTPLQKGYLRRIQTSSQHLLGIINDILDFSKIEAGKMSMERTDFELDKILDTVAGLIAEKADEKGLELIFDVDKAVPNYLIGDSLRLGQILINYANNAVKFTEHGEISVKVRKVEESDDEVTLRFEVSDTGVGITDEQKKRLFRSFEQADGSITLQHGGTGLGLAISKKLAEMMGGEVGLESRYGEGSTFWFTARLGKRKETGRKLLPALGLRGRRILVADDNEHARDSIAGMLRSMTFVVETVDSGPAAIVETEEALRRGLGYDIVFLDWRMPKMDGLEAAKAIQAIELDPKPHIAIITAYGREEIISAAQAAGIDQVLIKPVSPSILFDTVVNLLAGDRGVPSVPMPSEPIVEGDTGLSGARVLLVEDNELNQDVALEVLRGGGCIVAVASNGEDALRMVQEERFDIVLMDLQMPRMDGITATAEIRKNPSLNSMPVIAMTANVMKEDRDRCLAAGMNDFIAKPIDPDEMFSVMRRYYSGTGGSETIRRESVDRMDVKVPNIEGVDTQGGLKRVLGNVKLYLDLLERYRDGQRDAVKRIREALKEGDLSTAERQAHTLKGVSGNIGALGIQSIASQIEEAIGGKKNSDEIEKLLKELESKLEAVIQSIDEDLGACSTIRVQSRAKGFKGGDGEIKKNIDRLKRCLEASDSEAVELFYMLRDELSAAYGIESVVGLESKVRNYDFAAALEVLQGLDTGHT